MTDLIVRATATRWEADDFPGWIEVSVVDADGHEHRIIEKVPVLTRNEFTAATIYPAELWIGAIMDAIDEERVTITLASGVETVDGISTLDVAADDVRWL